MNIWASRRIQMYQRGVNRKHEIEYGEVRSRYFIASAALEHACVERAPFELEGHLKLAPQIGPAMV